MFDMLKGNRKKKEMQLFGIPEKKYTTDPKIISKMAAKALIDLYHDQEKYIAVLTEKVLILINRSSRGSNSISRRYKNGMSCYKRMRW